MPRAPLLVWMMILVAVNATTHAADNSATGNPASTQSVVVTPPPRASFHLYLLMGQSNMVGRDTRTMDEQTPDPHILSLNADDQWVVAKDPLHRQIGRSKVGVSPGLSFSHEMLKADPNVTIGLIPCAVGASQLRRWVKGGDLYQEALRRAKIGAQAGQIKGMIWHQGEAETTRQGNADSYARRLGKMIQDLREDLHTPNLPVVVGQLGEFLDPTRHHFAEVVRSQIKQVSLDVPNVGYADSAGLVDKGDKLHFSAQSQREFGQRFAHAMLKLEPVSPTTDQAP